MPLRPYQVDAVNGARKAVAAKKNPVVVIPTGGGKTHVGVSITRGAIEKKNPVLWIAHRKELIEQAADRLDLFGVPNAPIMAGLPEDRSRPVQVASVQTLVRREKPPAKVIVLDEAHHVRARTYRKILDSYPDAAVVGLTATPVRLDGKGLGDVFDEIVAPVSTRALIEQGFLLEPRYYAPTQPDFRGVRILGGEFDQGATAAIMQRPEIVGDVIRTIVEKGNGERGVVFAASIPHSRALVAQMRTKGIEAAHLDGGTPKAEREEILDDLRDGVLRVVSNVQVLTEGWDLPDLGFVSMARPTASWSLCLQMIGRCMRPSDAKDGAQVFDHAGNLVRHGFPTDEVEFDLGDAPVKKADAPKAKVCRFCFGTVPISVRTCPICGMEFPRQPRQGPTIVKGRALVEVKPEKPTAEQKERFYDRHLTICRELGYRRGWATRKYVGKFGVKPRGSWFRPLVEKHHRACRHVRFEDDGQTCRFCRRAFLR